MHVTRSDILELLYACLADLNEQLPPASHFQASPDTVLISDRGGLDSLGMVNLVAGIEEKLEARYNLRVTLPTDEKSGDDDPWRTVGTLADFVYSIVQRQQKP